MQEGYALMIHLTEIRFIISPQINSGKNSIKANIAGYNCAVESASQSKGSHNTSPSKGKLYCCWCLWGSRMAAQAGEGGVLLRLLTFEPRAGIAVSDHCWGRCHVAVQGAAAGRVEWMKSFHLKSLFDISNYQLTAVCEVFPLFQQPGCCFPACCSVKISLLQAVANWKGDS